ncbi:DNA-(apurinic or apyrimidinic site) lyase [Desulforamulus reducens MI-1]|uniref:Endonuclease III n=1 Tax=Desulforamulus reducens (strain ATCC BAA-1160 / DSM 100696 / MI-1) TaxID=349161 RepID=A4J6Y8_DESRM|nr:endonuclease III [Desulforamulus reducens]ABO50841.1 DNA-(apurinic or apyrimidinic site) lyase [Desulforamulus reducens MI-1]
MEDRIQQILTRLAETYPNATTDLKYTTPFELLVAVILSAQSTDAQVNKITEKLFQKYNTAASFAQLTPAEVAEHIKGCGLFRNKSKFLVETSRILVEKYNGQVPQAREELEKLPGVGRKTANVVLGVAFGQNTFPVDTHVHRLAHRLGLASGKTPEQVEKELCQIMPPELWQPCHHWIIQHGRRICDARNPRCGQCCLIDLCPEALKKGEF